MSARGALADRRMAAPRIDAEGVLDALPEPVLVVAADGTIAFVNLAAEQFFAAGAATLAGRPIADLVPADSPLNGLIEQARSGGSTISEYGVTLETPRIGAHLVSIDVAPLADRPGAVVVSLRERSMATKIDQQLTHRGVARSVTAMAAMLAHEVKNPLSGIRGAAQLLERDANPADLELTRLICDEADRIVGLVDRMEMFADRQPIAREPINIHQVLDHVRRIAEHGFARGHRFVELYDPSLPPVFGNRDLLVQVFLNLVKNAAEAGAPSAGEIILATAYRHGRRLAVGGGRPLQVPLMVSITDNGSGIPEELKAHLFDPFVTTKRNGTGLGLALVAKVIGDHGGVIEFDSQPRRTVFRVFLPVVTPGGVLPAGVTPAGVAQHGSG